MSVSQVAEALGISYSRAWQIEQTALRKLRWILRKRGLTLDDFIAVFERQHPLARIKR